VTGGFVGIPANRFWRTTLNENPSMKRLRALWALAVLPGSLSGCDGPLPFTSCVESVNSGIEVEVRNAATGAPEAFEASGYATDGQRRIALYPGQLSAAPEDRVLLSGITPAGIYHVRIEKSGFASWDTTGVRVRRKGGACPDVVTARFEARLVPLP
jgi:hypothetical protein